VEAGGFGKFIGRVARASVVRFSAFLVFAVLGITQDRIVAYLHGGQPPWEKIWQAHIAIQLIFICAAFLVMAYAFYSYLQAVLDPVLEPDTSIADAINYLANGSTAHLRQNKPPVIADFGPAKGQVVRQHGATHAHARDLLYEKMITGELSVWGRREVNKGMAFKSFESNRRPIEKTLWNHASLEWFPIFYNAKDIAQTVMQGGHTDYCYAEMMFSKKQIERIWPPRARY
jgi:hypothetical protein